MAIAGGDEHVAILARQGPQRRGVRIEQCSQDRREGRLRRTLLARKPRIDKSAIRAGAYLIGGDCPAEDLVVKSQVYGAQPRRPPPRSNLSEISDRIRGARLRLDEIARALRESRKR